MREQPASERIHNYQEVPYGYTPEQAMEEAIRCLQCAKPTCMDGCPVNVNIPGFLALVADGDFQGAVEMIKLTNALPAITGRVCPQEVQCEGVCVLHKKHEPVAIGRLERFVADWEAEQGKIAIPQAPPQTGKKVAVVGSGPAGLTAAADLARMDIRISLKPYERGGVLVYGIPVPPAGCQTRGGYVKAWITGSSGYIVGVVATR
jgi:glutamate synthase (NADPH/NADH) small chain